MFALVDLGLAAVVFVNVLSEEVRRARQRSKQANVGLPIDQRGARLTDAQIGVRNGDGRLAALHEGGAVVFLPLDATSEKTIVIVE